MKRFMALEPFDLTLRSNHAPCFKCQPPGRGKFCRFNRSAGKIFSGASTATLFLIVITAHSHFYYLTGG
jgi:hypothetical protein